MSTPQELIDFLNVKILSYEALIVAENNKKTYLDSAVAIIDANIEDYTNSKARFEEIITKLEEIPG